MIESGPSVYLDVECRKIVDRNIKKFGFWLFWFNLKVLRTHDDYSLDICTMFSCRTVISIRDYASGYIHLYDKKYIELARAIGKDLEALLGWEIRLIHDYNKNEN